MFTKFKTSKTRNRIRDSTKTMMIAVLVTSMMFMTASIYTNQTNDSKALVYAQSSNESNEYGSTSDSNVSLINTTSNMISPTITISPSKSIEKEFWINTMHLDGNTNVKAGTKCDTCPQNTPSHPAEKPPLNSTIPTGGGFKVTGPNKVGAWDFRAFAFSPSQIVVNQGDKVTLHFVGVQGAHHFIKIDGIGDFPLSRGQILTVSFIASNPGTITYICTLHLPNMVGQILVLPESI
jgi:plastocyanin